MFKKLLLPVLLAASLCAAGPALAYEAITGPLGLLHHDKGRPFDGYTLYTPHESGQYTYLIDLDGNIVHQWKADNDAFYAELLPNGHILRAEKGPGSPVTFGGWHGALREYDWDGKLVWEYVMRNDKMVAHHGFERLPNGNTALLVWEYKPWEEAFAKGRRKDHPNNYPEGFTYPDGKVLHGIWPDAIIEVNPKGEIVWEYHVWDNIGTGPDQFDINYTLPPSYPAKYMAGPDWTHWNAVRYDPKTDKYIVDSRDWGEIYVIDRKTKKMEWRWGNPAAYGKGKAPSGYTDNGDQVLFGPHDVRWLPNGNVSILNNGTYRPSTNYSSAMEIKPRGFDGGEVVWEFRTGDPNSFSSDYQSAAQKLPNDNWLITSTNNGHLFEVTNGKDVVWEYANPISGNTAYCVKHDKMPWNQVHRAFRYARDDERFKGKDLTPKGRLAAGCPDWQAQLDGAWKEPKNKSAKPPRGEER